MDNLNSILDKLKGVVQDKMNEINTEVKNKIGQLDNTVINKGIDAVEKRLTQYKIIGGLLYAVVILLLFYIIYLLNRYH